MYHRNGCPKKPPPGMSARRGWYTLKDCTCDEIIQKKMDEKEKQKIEKKPRKKPGPKPGSKIPHAPHKPENLLERATELLSSDKSKAEEYIHRAAEKLGIGYYTFLNLNPEVELVALKLTVARQVNPAGQDRVSYEVEEKKKTPKCLVITFTTLITEEEALEVGREVGWDIVYSKKQLLLRDDLSLIVFECKGATTEQRQKMEELCRRTSVRWIAIQKLNVTSLRNLLRMNKPQ